MLLLLHCSCSCFISCCCCSAVAPALTTITSSTTSINWRCLRPRAAESSSIRSYPGQACGASAGHFCPAPCRWRCPRCTPGSTPATPVRSGVALHNGTTACGGRPMHCAPAAAQGRRAPGVHPPRRRCRLVLAASSPLQTRVGGLVAVEARAGGVVAVAGSRYRRPGVAAVVGAADTASSRACPPRSPRLGMRRCTPSVFYNPLESTGRDGPRASAPPVYDNSPVPQL